MTESTNPLDRFIVSGDYGTSVDLECLDHSLFIISFSYPANLVAIIATAEEHLKEKHVDL